MTGSEPSRGAPPASARPAAPEHDEVPRLAEEPRTPARAPAQPVPPGLTDAHIWDASSVAALDAVTAKYASRGKSVRIVGLNAPSARMHADLSGELATH
ncbi:hypothetical protein SBRY_40419 [Actinacidiphila bryophytorum]|uniref:STAS domain-containing protein n=1 Tax=Actinacidiphila bryophytorum TaxID=1436133 RepID=A0A9W4H319_9ACTN|nr:hypothetical protein SBRY_40419 [Actinacidiphila bryophytorum]